MEVKIAKGVNVTEQTTQIGEQSNDNVPQTKEKSKASNQPETIIEYNAVWEAIFDLLKPEADETKKTEGKKLFVKYFQQIVAKSPIASKYNILIQHDEGSMMRGDIDSIYAAVTKFSEKKPILLILYSRGGEIEPAYLIGNLCREYTKDKFVVVVPRRAKSAATLLCCAADEIHMGSLSELGPIDPLINDMPALGLKDSIAHIAELTSQYPKAADMFARYLNYSLKPIDIGYYERVAKSAIQYAERLLLTHKDILITSPVDIADKLVYHYKDHGFVIDKNEAKILFGDKIVKIGTDEYSLGNRIYEELGKFRFLINYMGHYFYWIGSIIDTLPEFAKKK